MACATGEVDGLCQRSRVAPEKAAPWIGSVGLDTTERQPEVTLDGVTYRWRGQLTDAEMVDLVRAHGGQAAQGWWDQIRAYSLGWSLRPLALAPARTSEVAPPAVGFPVCRFIADRSPRCRSGAEP